MTAHSELQLRARANAHDITSPSSTHSGQDVAERVVGHKVVNILLPAETAGTDYSFPVCGVPESEYPNGAEVISVTQRTPAAVTENATTYTLHTFTSYDSDGGTPLAAATISNQLAATPPGTGTTTALKAYSAVLSTTLANRVIPAGGSLVLVKTHGSTGTAYPAGTAYEVVLKAL